MQRDFLKDLGLEAEVIDKIMKQNGEDINTAKKANADELKKAQNDVKDLQDKLEGFKDIKPDELKQTIDDLKKEIKDKQDAYDKEASERAFNEKLNAAIDALGPKVPKESIRAALDVKTLFESKNQDTDIAAALAKCSETTPVFFGDVEPITNPTGAVDENKGGNPKTPTMPKYF